MSEFPNSAALAAEADAMHARDTRGQAAPATRIRPRDAATLLILDRSGPVPRVLMGRRHAGHKFMPDKFVFPGGRAERADAAAPIASGLVGEVEAALIARTTRGNAARARRLALAAIRETFEETGLVIGKKLDFGQKQAMPGALAAAGVWGEFLATGHLPDLAPIRYLARAITPPGRTKRFDTRFFIVDASAISHTIGDVVGPDSELTELAWLTLEETISQPLPVITRIILGDLGERLAGAGIEAPAPVPFYYRVGKEFRRELIG